MLIGLLWFVFGAMSMLAVMTVFGLYVDAKFDRLRREAGIVKQLEAER